MKAIVLFFGFFAFFVLFIFFSKELGNGVRQGISLCGELVIPALFVFLCFCEWVCLSQSIQSVSFVLQPLFRFVLGKGFTGNIPLLLCLIGGYPMGASSLAIMRKNNIVSSDSVKQLALWIFCPSPSFVITGVGQGMLGSLRAGLILWCCCVVSCFVSGFVICRFWGKNRKEPHLDLNGNLHSTNCFSVAIGSATEKMLVICATVVLIAGVLSVVSVLPLPAGFQSILYLFTEVTNGCTYLVGKGGSLAELGGVLMFGGIATHLQCRMLLGEDAPPYKLYFLVRICQTLLCYGLVWLFCSWFPNVVQTISVGKFPTVGSVSVLPTVGLLATCCVFLCSVSQKPLNRRKYCEKSGIYS